jgi:MraZ protein
LTLPYFLAYFWVKVGKSGEFFHGRKKFMFRGQFTYSIDSKGRFSIPAKLRKHVSPEANDTFIMTRGTASCIDVYPLDQWQLLEDKLKSLNQFKPTDSRFVRTLLQHIAEDSLDAQSRLLIPQELKDYAKIDKEVLILGVLNKIEVWNPEIFKEYLNQSSETYEEIAAKVMS